MKLSIILTVAILALAGFFGWQGEQRASHARIIHLQLLKEATSLGMRMEGEGDKRHLVSMKRTVREDKERVARDFAKEFIAFAKEIDVIEKDGGQPDPEVMKHAMQMMNRMFDFDSSQMRIVIGELREAKDLKDETRKGLLTFAIMGMTNDHPQAALALLTESSDLLENKFMGEHMVSQALGKWAEDDPMGAMRWIKENEKKFPDLITEQTKTGLLTGAARENPKLAFELADELNIETRSVMGIIADAAQTDEQRTAVLALIRERFSGEENENKKQNAISSLTSYSFVQDRSVEQATAWLDGANLSAKEMDAAVSSLGDSIQKSDTGKWIEWIDQSNASEEVAKQTIRNMAGRWTEADYVAAGEWLAAAPEGKAKQAAVAGYVVKVYPYEPEVAMQWAQTMPAGEVRDEVFEAIYERLPRNTEAEKEAAKAFAEQHGIR